MRLVVLLAMLFGAGCATTGPCGNAGGRLGPRCVGVRLIPEGNTWSAEDLRQMQRGVARWRALCFSASVGGLPQPGEYVVPVRRDYGLAQKWLVGLTNGVTIWLGGSRGSRLAATAAHEVGHVFGLEHLEDGRAGAMSRFVGEGYLTEADREEACRAAGHCSWCAP